MGLIKDNKNLNQRYASTVNTVSSEEILNNKSDKNIPERKIKAYPCTIKVDTNINNSIKALGVMGKTETPKTFLEWALDEYINNNLTADEKKNFDFLKDQFDTKEMLKREKK